jgi:hypothetical protein
VVGVGVGVIGVIGVVGVVGVALGFALSMNISGFVNPRRPMAIF